MSGDALNGHVNYEAVLADLLEKRDQIETAITAIKLIMGSGASATPAGPHGIPPNAFFTLGIGDAVRKYLDMIKSKQTLTQIVKALEQGGMPPLKPNTVYAALRRRESVMGDLIRISADEWGLKEWFPNTPITKKATKAKSAKKNQGSKKRPPANKSKKPAPPPSPKLDGATTLEACEQILLRAGKPRHINVLMDKLAELGKATTRQALSSNLGRDSKKRFYNEGGNVWGLTKWQESPRAAAA